MVSELINKYVWLIRTLTRAGEGGLTLEEIQARWERTWNTPYPRRTFNNHREAILEVFGIPIRCDRRTNRYAVRYGEQAGDARARADWLIDTFTVGHLLTLGNEQLSGRVSTEEIPSGHKWLVPLMQAMLDNHEVCIRYRKYTREEDERLHIRPYAVKEDGRRWYVIADCIERGALRAYGLDRITDLQETGVPFRLPEGFDIDLLLADSFGMYLPEAGAQACSITFLSTAREAHYLRDLPLHHSQRELPAEEAAALGATADMPCAFRLRTIPNEGLLLELCRHGGRIRIVSPAEIARAVRDEHRRAAANYASDLDMKN